VNEVHQVNQAIALLGGGVLGNSLGALRHSVLGQLTRQEEADGCLDLPASDGGPLVVMGQTRGLSGNALEDVVHERVHDGHGLGGDTGVGVDLLQHLVDVDGVALLPPPLLLLVSLGNGLLGLASLLGGLSGCFGGHGGALVAASVGLRSHPTRLYIMRLVTQDRGSEAYLSFLLAGTPNRYVTWILSTTI